MPATCDRWTHGLANSAAAIRLAVVMGHTQCGAIEAAVGAITGDRSFASKNLASIVDRVTPAVEQVVSAHSDLERSTVLSESMRLNVRASAVHLRHGSALREQRIAQRKLRVVGAAYDLHTGVVDFFDGADAVR